MFYARFFILLFMPSIQGTKSMDYDEKFIKLLSLFKQEDPSVCTALVYGKNLRLRQAINIISLKLFYFFSFDLKFPSIRIDLLQNFETYLQHLHIFNKCYFLLLKEENSEELNFIIERVAKVIKRYPKFYVIISQTENVFFENKENSPLAFISNKVKLL